MAESQKSGLTEKMSGRAEPDLDMNMPGRTEHDVNAKHGQDRDERHADVRDVPDDDVLLMLLLVVLMAKLLKK